MLSTCCWNDSRVSSVMPRSLTVSAVETGTLSTTSWTWLTCWSCQGAPSQMNCILSTLSFSRLEDIHRLAICWPWIKLRTWLGPVIGFNHSSEINPAISLSKRIQLARKKKVKIWTFVPGLWEVQRLLVAYERIRSPSANLSPIPNPKPYSSKYLQYTFHSSVKGNYWRPQFSAECLILSRAAEFACFCGICMFSQDFAEFGTDRWSVWC